MQHDRPSHQLAVLLAGQARTFLEPRVRQQLLNAVSSSSLFAHLSTEHSYAEWHNFSVPVSPAPALTANRLTASLRREFRGKLAYSRVESDEEVSTSSRWIGPVAGMFSALFLRWLLLDVALQHEEHRRGSLFRFVLRLRPDLVLLCSVPSDLAAWMGDHDALQQGDWALLMKRRAADLALGAYLHANLTYFCSHRIEACVPSLLVSRNYSVASVKGFAWVVRPETFCSALSGKLSESLGCGRGVIGRQPRAPCTSRDRRLAKALGHAPLR